jgi:hypothetical protein
LLSNAFLIFNGFHKSLIRTEAAVSPNELIPHSQHLPPDVVGRWGKMNGQQMVEYATDFFKISTGTLNYPLLTPDEQLPQYREFLLSKKSLGKIPKPLCYGMSRCP